MLLKMDQGLVMAEERVGPLDFILFVCFGVWMLNVRRIEGGGGG